VLVRSTRRTTHDMGRSEGLRARIDVEVAAILEKELARATELLPKHRAMVTRWSSCCWSARCSTAPSCGR
jgi:hypothetical protein